ncbi:MAG: VCBS repeat-containing protein, partial [Planctomycetota bacterium]
LNDLDGDGHLEILVLTLNRLFLLRGDPADDFSRLEVYATGSNPLSLATLDMTGDSVLDLVTADFGSESASILIGSGLSLPESTFRRGDIDGNGTLSLTDAISVLQFLFQGGTIPACPDAADTDDDGAIVLTDPIRLLTHLFLAGPPPEAPGPSCGIDPTADSLRCTRSCN